MRSRRKPWVTVLAALLAGGVTYAQSPIPKPDKADKSDKADKTDAAKAAKQLKLSLPEMVTRSEALDVQIKADMRHVLHLQTKARQEKDVIKLNCINDKLVQLKAQVNIFDSASALLKAGLESGATADDKQPVFGEVAQTGAAIKTLRAEADVCVGEPELFKQESSSEVKRPDIPDDPAGNDPFTPGGGDFEPPAYASPYC
jgi:hypothetical protein